MIKSGARLFAFEHGELLAQGHRLQSKSVAWQNECPNARHHRNEQAHRSDNSARLEIEFSQLSASVFSTIKFDDPQERSWSAAADLANVLGGFDSRRQDTRAATATPD